MVVPVLVRLDRVLVRVVVSDDVDVSSPLVVLLNDERPLKTGRSLSVVVLPLLVVD